MDKNTNASNHCVCYVGCQNYDHDHNNYIKRHNRIIDCKSAKIINKNGKKICEICAQLYREENETLLI